MAFFVSSCVRKQSTTLSVQTLVFVLSGSFQGSRSLQFQTEKSAESKPATIEQSAAILVVDDNDQLLSVTKEILEVHGFQVFAASSVSAALSHLTSASIDMIICDVVMPERNGFEFRDEVLRNPEWCDLPFIFLTGLSRDDEVRMGKASGCDEYLTKPFDPDDLVSVVKGKVALLRKRQAMADARMESYRRRIIHTLSHEFRTPLVSINTGTELLLDQHLSLNDEQVKKLLESVLRGGQRLERLVDDFMLLQQIDLGHAEYTCELYQQKVPLRAILESAVEGFMDSQIHPEQFDIQVVLPAEEVLEQLYVKVYDVQIVNLFNRLLSNAIKFAGPKQPIRIELGLEAGEVYAAVLDNGPGLDASKEAEPHDSALKPFAQINRETYEQQGCGLGLTIAHYFAAINGGKLFLRNRLEQKGLEARVVFPQA